MFIIFFVGIDIGTSSTKGVLVDKDGKIICQSQRSHAVDYKAVNQAEQNPDKIWWHETLDIIREIIKKSNISVKSIMGVGCSGIFPVVVPIDKDGCPLREGILYNIDKRSKTQIRYIQKKFTKKGMFKNENNLTYQSILPKIKWIKDNEPSVWSKTQHVLDARGYVVFKLTGECVTDHYTAFHGGFGYSLPEYKWRDKDFETSEIDINIMPKIKWPFEIAGYIHSHAAKTTGLLEGTPVITGTGDALAEMLSAGIYKEKQSVLLYGSTMPIMTIENIPPDQSEYTSAPSWDKGKSIISSGIRSGMSTFLWLRDLVGYQTVEDLFLEMKDIDNIKASEDGLLSFPYFTSQIEPKNDFQRRASFLGLTQHHGTRHLFKSLMEGLGLSLRLSMEDFPRIYRIKVIGGGTKSRGLLQIISDICNVEQQTILNNIGAPLGVAWLAGYGIGFLKKSSLEHWVAKGVTYKPRVEKKIIYEDIYKEFKKISDTPIDFLNYYG